MPCGLYDKRMGPTKIGNNNKNYKKENLELISINKNLKTKLISKENELNEIKSE
jgi:hypothetical protein